MNDMIHIALGVLRAILRFRWVALLVAFLVSTAGWLFIAQMDDYYQAEARVFVDSNRVLGPLLKGLAIQPDVNERVQLMSRTLLNRPNLEKLSRMTDLDIDATTALEKEQLIDELGRTVQLQGTSGNSSLYTVRYTHKNPALARSMVQSLITVFIESTIGDERDDNTSAQVFLDQQVKDYEQRLAEADRRLSDFKRENAGKMPSEAGSYYQRLEFLKSDARAARLELGEAESRLASLLNQLAREPRTLSESEGSAAVLSTVGRELQAKRGELTALLARYTERHPRINQLRDSITQLEEEQQRESTSGYSSTETYTVVANPAYQEISKLLAEAEARLAELGVRTKALDEQVIELNATVETIPKIEATLKQLDRDYEVVKAQYTQLLERRESARLSEQVEQNVDDVKFRVIDPPFVPSKPSGPRKLLFSAAAMVAGLGAGVGLAFVLSIVFPVFYDAETIVKKTGHSVLGTVALQKTESTRTFRGVVAWGIYLGLLSMLLVIFLLIVAHYSGMISDNLVAVVSNSPLGALFDQAGKVISKVVELLVR